MLSIGEAKSSLTQQFVTHFVVTDFSTGSVMKERTAGCFFTRIIHSSLLIRPSFAMSASSNVCVQKI